MAQSLLDLSTSSRVISSKSLYTVFEVHDSRNEIGGQRMVVLAMAVVKLR